MVESFSSNLGAFVIAACHSSWLIEASEYDFTAGISMITTNLLRSFRFPSCMLIQKKEPRPRFGDKSPFPSLIFCDFHMIFYCIAVPYHYNIV